MEISRAWLIYSTLELESENVNVNLIYSYHLQLFYNLIRKEKPGSFAVTFSSWFPNFLFLFFPFSEMQRKQIKSCKDVYYHIKQPYIHIK